MRDNIVLNNTVYSPTPAQLSSPISINEETLLVDIPESIFTDGMYAAISAGSRAEEIPERKKNDTKYTYSAKKGKKKVEKIAKDGSTELITVNGLQIRKEAKDDTTLLEITLTDLERAAHGSIPARKLLIFCLMKANKQALSNGELTQNQISFTYREIIELGMYNTPQSARVGVEAGLDTLCSIMIKGKAKKSPKSTIEITSARLPFTGYDNKGNKGTVEVYLNDKINWSFLAQFFMKLPHYYFSLPSKASDLLYYIFYLARQHTKKKNIIDIGGDQEAANEYGEVEIIHIEERAIQFNIKCRTLQQRLYLPSETGNKDTKRTIRQPIEEAVDQIQTAYKKAHGKAGEKQAPALKLELIVPNSRNITDFLDNGVLQVTLTGEYATALLTIADNTQKRIDAATAKKERIQEKAIAINTAKALEEERKRKKKAE